jgi:hypothetical protein
VDKPFQGNDKAVEDNKVTRRFIKTRTGHILGFGDEPGPSLFFVQTNKEHRFEMDDTDQHISLQSKNGHRIAIDDASDKIIFRDKNGSNQIVIDSQGSYINIKCAGDITIESQGKITMNAQNGITLKSPQTINVLSDSTTVVQGQAQAYLIGGMVQINPPAPPPPDIDVPHELGESGAMQGSPMKIPNADPG